MIRSGVLNAHLPPRTVYCSPCKCWTVVEYIGSIRGAEGDIVDFYHCTHRQGGEGCGATYVLDRIENLAKPRPRPPDSSWAREMARGFDLMGL